MGTSQESLNFIPLAGTLGILNAKRLSLGSLYICFSWYLRPDLCLGILLSTP